MSAQWPDPSRVIGLELPAGAEATSSARVTVSLEGAHVVDWRTVSGRRPLYMSPTADLHAHGEIFGGIPVCWPQFAGNGPLPEHHGTARRSLWRVMGPTIQVRSEVGVRRVLKSEDAPSETLSQLPPECEGPALASSCALRLDEAALCPLAGEPRGADGSVKKAPAIVELCVTLLPEALDVRLWVRNPAAPGMEAPVLSFTTALHTYLRVSDTASAFIDGLDGAAFYDKNLPQPTIPGKPPGTWAVDATDILRSTMRAPWGGNGPDGRAASTQPRWQRVLPFHRRPGDRFFSRCAVSEQPLDRIFAGTRGRPIRVRDLGVAIRGARKQLHATLTITSAATLPDSVVWSPPPVWVESGGSRGGVPLGGQREYVCCESGAVVRPVLLTGGSQWSGNQRLVAGTVSSPDEPMGNKQDALAAIMTPSRL